MRKHKKKRKRYYMIVVTKFSRLKLKLLFVIVVPLFLSLWIDYDLFGQGDDWCAPFFCVVIIQTITVRCGCDTFFSFVKNEYHQFDQLSQTFAQYHQINVDDTSSFNKHTHRHNNTHQTDSNCLFYCHQSLQIKRLLFLN